MNYSECLDFLSELGHELRGAKFGLGTISAILKSLGSPEKKYPTSIVAGTNGKGSTSAILASILESGGYRARLYTSPHLLPVDERDCINGDENSDEKIA